MSRGQGRDLHRRWNHPDTEHEASLIRAFVRPDRQARYLDRPASQARPGFIAERLYHLADLDLRHARRIEPSTRPSSRFTPC